MFIIEVDFLQVWINWVDVFILILKIYEDGGIDVVCVFVNDILDVVYGYNFGFVLFKFILVSGEKMFCLIKDGVLVYFVGYDENYFLDGGFGIKGWCLVDYDSFVYFIDGDVGMWMGWVKFIDKDGNVVIVNKIFGYKKDEEGMLCVVFYYLFLFYELV